MLRSELVFHYTTYSDRLLLLMDMKSIKDLIQMLDMNETIDQLAKANSVRLYGYVLRKDKNNFIRRALDFNVKGTRKRSRA